MQENWKVIYYLSKTGENPVRNFIDSLQTNLKAKIFRILLNIEEYGISSAIPHIKKLSGTDLWEIRILGSDNVRIIYITQKGNKLILLHAFFKKKQKTPKKDLEIAINRAKEYTA